MKYFFAAIIVLTTMHAQAQDTDAAAFITATGITDTKQISAINKLVTDAKAAGVWTKMRVLYPFVGGTPARHSYNLKDPASYQITWGGTVVHDSTGIKGNGTSGYGNTNFALTNLYGSGSLESFSWGWTIYNRSNFQNSGIDMGKVA